MQKAVEIKNVQGLTLRGMLHTPDHIQGKIPMVCIFHGFTGNKMEPHFIFVKLSRQLEKLGIGSLRFDFAGSGESDGEFRNMTISGELSDAKCILAFAKSLDFVDEERIGLTGLSMGGVVASLLARDCHEEIKSICLWAPAGNIKELILYEGWADLEKMERDGYQDKEGNVLGLCYVQDIEKLDLYRDLGKFNKQVLICHGDKDTTIVIENSKKYMDKYGENARFHVIKDADHTFNNMEWESEIIQETAKYLKESL